MVKAGNQDIRNYPHNLQDGDIIGVRLTSENKNGSDDFQTDQDLISKAEFDLMKKKQKEEQQQKIREA